MGQWRSGWLLAAFGWISGILIVAMDLYGTPDSLQAAWRMIQRLPDESLEEVVAEKQRAVEQITECRAALQNLPAAPPGIECIIGVSTSK